MFDISIIIVSWNAKGHLINCLNSLSNPRGFTQEIIVIDNGSSDGSVEIIENQFPQVKLLKNNDNLGFAKANNIGIRASTGRYVCLINSDVIVLDGCIKKLIEFMDKNPLVGM
jgi:GT2 family glycosyltransferase